MLPFRYWALVTLIVILTLARITSTHLTFAQTLAEPVHVAAGHDRRGIRGRRALEDSSRGTLRRRRRISLADGWLVLSAFDWLERQPTFERIGKTLRLYHVP